MKTIISIVLFLNFSALAKTPVIATKKVADVPAAVKTINFIESEGKFGFVATGKPAMIKIIGEGQGPKGSLVLKDKKLNGSLTVDLNKLTTKIELRDDHLKNKYLEIAKYPEAEIILKDYALDLDALSASAVEKDFNGDLKLHGITKPVSGKISFAKDNLTLTASAKFKIKVTDYLDTLPSYAGIKIADEVEVTVDMKTISQ